jgi:hypothetical protein
MTRKTYHEVKETAYHEAVARLLGIPVDWVTIRPSKNFLGLAETIAWPTRGDERAEEDSEEEWQWRLGVAYSDAKFALAGPLAEMKYRDTGNGEDFAGSGDLLDVAKYLQIASGFTFEVLVPGKPLQQNNGEASRLWERLQADTADLVESYWPSIERVAEALLIHGELGQEQIDALIY